MKKIISLLLVIILAFSLTGCLFAPGGYEYDEEGRVIRRPYSPSSYMTIEYDTSGNKVLETVYRNSDNVKEQAIHYENGIKSFIQDYDDNGTVGSERYYNSKEEEIRIVYYVDGTFNGSEDKEYDEHGNTTLISRRDANNEEEEMGVKNGIILWPMRTALSGKQSTPGGAIEIAYILGKEETLRRINEGIAKLS